MMSIWTRWLEPCLIGLSTSLQNIITVSKYSLPLSVIVGTLSECWSIVVIFACWCLYYHSTGHQWEWERIDDHDLLLIHSCCLLINKTHIWLFAGPPRLYYKITGYGSTWIAWDTWTTLKVRDLFSLWSFIAHPVSQSMDDSHLSSLSLRSYCLQIRPRLWLWLRLCCIFLLSSHRPFFSQRQSPSTTTISSTLPMLVPSSSPSFHHSTTQLQPSESGEHRAAWVLGIANSSMHSSIHACASLSMASPL